MTGRTVLLLVGLSVVTMVCSSCSPGGGTDPTSQKVAPVDPSTLKQQGVGGVKAAGGGGLVGPPQPAKPGEKVGAPAPGDKSGGA